MDEKRTMRDAKGRFLKGAPSMSPGRPKAPHAEAVAAVRRAAIDIGLPLLIEAAKGGDLEAVKELCRLGFPRMKAVTPLDAVPLDRMADLTAKAESVLEVVTSGQVSAETAEILLSALRTVAEVNEVAELKERLAGLEEKAQAGRVGVLVTPGMLSPEAWIAEAQRTVDDGETVEP